MIKKSIINTILFLVLSAICIIKSAPAQIFNDQIFKMSQFLHITNNYYVDTIDQEEIIEEAIVSILKDLDPHSTYIKKDDVEALNEPLRGNFEGIGIQFNVLNDTVIVVSPIAGGPSEKVGLKAGDRIIKVGDEVIAGIGITSKGVRDRLLGEKGTSVDISVKRRMVDELLEFTIVRDKIPIFSLDASYMVNDSIGYIKLNRFSATTITEFTKALNSLKEDGLKHLVLDLTNNGGGYLNVAIKLADEFLEGDKVIVFTEGKNSPKKTYKTKTDGSFEEGKLVVMIDEGSASASEIVSGAVQDWDRGVIVGRRSFGKGLVQRPFQLRDGSMVRLTVAKYYTPSGRLIQKPYENGVKEYRKELTKRKINGELCNKDSIHFPDSLKYSTLINKRLVYGGGGIMPDLFVPLDTSMNSDYYQSIISKGIMNHFALEYLDKNRKVLKSQYPDIKAFKRGFTITQQMLKNFYAYAEKKEVKKNEEDIQISLPLIKLQLKALLARDLWTSSEYYEISNDQDKAFQKAVDVIKQDIKFFRLLGNHEEISNL